MNIVLQTPIEPLFSYQGSRIFIKRDDLIPYSYGGNKVRIGLELMAALEESGADYLISYGSVHSNLNRVMAHLARDAGIGCAILIGRTMDEADGRNTHLCREAGAEIYYCPKGGVEEALKDRLREARHRGKRPFYVYGSPKGTGHESLMQRAYQKAYREIDDHMTASGSYFDCICLAAGTGMSLQGLLLGREKGRRQPEEEGKKAAPRGYGEGKRPHIHGISIARRVDYWDEAAGISQTGTYAGDKDALFESGLEETIIRMGKEYGICLDPVYTGKAFYGMLQEIEKGRLKGNILFIHTGGYPIYEEWMEKRKEAKRGRP